MQRDRGRTTHIGVCIDLGNGHRHMKRQTGHRQRRNPRTGRSKVEKVEQRRGGWGGGGGVGMLFDEDEEWDKQGGGRKKHRLEDLCKTEKLRDEGPGVERAREAVFHWA